MIKKILGLLLVASPLIIIFIALGISTGWFVSFCIIVISIISCLITVILVLLGMHLLND